MPIDIFSKRQKRLRGEMPGVYRYDTLPSELRTQVLRILERALDWGNAHGDSFLTASPDPDPITSHTNLPRCPRCCSNRIPECSRPPGNARFWTPVDHQMLWSPPAPTARLARGGVDGPRARIRPYAWPRRSTGSMAAAAWSTWPSGSAGPRGLSGSGRRGGAPSSSRATLTSPAAVLGWIREPHPSLDRESP